MARGNKSLGHKCQPKSIIISNVFFFFVCHLKRQPPSTRTITSAILTVTYTLCIPSRHLNVLVIIIINIVILIGSHAHFTMPICLSSHLSLLVTSLATFIHCEMIEKCNGMEVEHQMCRIRRSGSNIHRRYNSNNDSSWYWWWWNMIQTRS